MTLEEFYQQKVKEAKEAAIEFMGNEEAYRDFIRDAKDIRDEYDDLCGQEQADEFHEAILERQVERYYVDLLLEGEAADAELLAKIQEARDSEAANNWGDQLWLNGEDPWADQEK